MIFIRNKRIINTCFRILLTKITTIVMKCTILLCLLLTLQSFAANIYAQSASISIKAKYKTVREVLNEIEEKSGLYFTYDANVIDTKKIVNIDVENKEVKDILNILFDGESVGYDIKDKHIVIRKTPVDSNQMESQVNKKTIRGRITDQSGEAIIGASIMVKGKPNLGTITDLDGNFSLSVDEDAVIVITYVSYKTQEISVKDKIDLQIVLQEESQILDELVVVGYGTQKRGNLTSAISSIKSEDIMKGTNAGLAQQLQGKIPGLQIRHQAGEPGTFNSTINVRGFGSAIFVIDGIVRESATEFQQLNPNDIENISILKDASAAVYGLNAVNGVVIVTTKKGISSAPRFNYSSMVGWQSPTNRPKMSSASQYMELNNERNYYKNGIPAITEEELNKWREGGEGYKSTDWYNETMKKSAMQQSHDFSIRGGSDLVDYYVSFGHFNDKGLFKSNDMSYNRYNLRSNLTLKLSKYLKADIQLAGRYGKRDYPGADGFMWTYKGTIISLPTERPYINDDPNYPADIRNRENPVLMSQKKYAGYSEEKSKSFQSTGSITYDAPFLPGFQLKGTVAYDSYNGYNKNLWKNYRIYNQDLVSSPRGTQPRIQNRSDDQDRLVMQAQASYNQIFLQAHNVGATLVAERKTIENKYMVARREYDAFTNDVIDLAGGKQYSEGSESEEALMSYIGRFNYDFKSRYLIEFAFRYDGSYRYAVGDRWGFFPTVSGGWRISEEPFIKKNLHFVDNLKLRASYGMIGETVGDAFQFVPGYTSVTNQGAEFVDGEYVGGLAAPGVINPNFTWTKSKIFDIGIDVSLFNNLLSFEFDYYQRNMSGLPKQRESGASLPNTFGGSMPLENLESNRTQGIDFVVSHNNKIGQVSYDASFNLNLARTMYRKVDKADARSSFDRWRNGLVDRWNDMEWGWDKTGQFQNYDDIYNGIVHGYGNEGNSKLLPGDYIFYDANGDGIIDSKDERPLYRNRTPKLFYGFTMNAAWNNFDFNAVFQGAALYTVRFDEVFSQMFFNDGNLPAYFHDRWRPENIYDPNNTNWIAGKWPAARNAEDMNSSYRKSQVFYMNAAFLRLKNIEFGYTIPNKYTRKYYVENLRFYVSGTNLLTFTDSFLKQFDPEKYEGSAYKGGYDYPLTKSFNIGVNISF